jgi:hypothetical protein
MNFLVMPIFTFFILGSLSIVFLSGVQSISSQSDTNSSSIENISVKIISPSQGKLVPTGELTISGISSDNQEKECVVFVDWNDLKPFQSVRAAGPGGIDDYSEWIFTYDSSYHEIIEGENELTSKITCLDENKPLTKWNSINVTGSTTESMPLSNFSRPNTSFTITSTESKDKQQQQQVPLKTVMPGSNPKDNATTPAVIEDNLTLLQTSNLIPGKESSTFIESVNTQQQQVPLKTVMPGSNPKDNATTPAVIEDNLTLLQMSNNTTNTNTNTNTTVEENVSPIPLSNSSDSQIEMIVPNESTNEKKINNTNTSTISRNGNTPINNLTTNQFPEFTEQQLQPPIVEEQLQQPSSNIDNNTEILNSQQLQPPIVEEQDQQQQQQQQQQQLQQLQPPIVEEQDQQPSSNIDNNTEILNSQRPELDNNPTEGMFPPFKLPSIFP